MGVPKPLRSVGHARGRVGADAVLTVEECALAEPYHQTAFALWYRDENSDRVLDPASQASGNTAIEIAVAPATKSQFPFHHGAPRTLGTMAVRHSRSAVMTTRGSSSTGGWPLQE